MRSNIEELRGEYKENRRTYDYYEQRLAATNQKLSKLEEEIKQAERLHADNEQWKVNQAADYYWRSSDGVIRDLRTDRIQDSHLVNILSLCIKKQDIPENRNVYANKIPYIMREIKRRKIQIGIETKVCENKVTGKEYPWLHQNRVALAQQGWELECRSALTSSCTCKMVNPNFDRRI